MKTETENEAEPAAEPCRHLLGEWQGNDEGGTFGQAIAELHGESGVVEWFRYCPRCGVKLEKK